MSTNLECEFVEVEPGKWYYLLEDPFTRDPFDWRETAQITGPFASEDKAHEHLSNNHANPGGFSTCPHEHFRMDEVMERLLENVQSPIRPRLGRYF